MPFPSCVGIRVDPRSPVNLRNVETLLRKEATGAELAVAERTVMLDQFGLSSSPLLGI